MKKTTSFIWAFLFMAIVACSSKSGEPIVRIKTNYGNLKLKLYNETPVHRDNFLKLAKEGYFNGTLFHRVIKNFMIQGGDPDSKNAQGGVALGQGGPGYTLPAEIDYPKFFHKKGALAAAREGDRQNPERRSSGSQFYIVQGEISNDSKLTKLENKFREDKKREIFNQVLAQYEDSLNTLQQLGDQDSMMDMQKFVMGEVQKQYAAQPEFTMPERVKEIYKTRGGTPHLDGGYTVFGEVIEDKTLFEQIASLFGRRYGLEVIERIAQEQTDGRNRPLKDVVILDVKVIRE
ncbi:peptidylprolyl isomerase [Saccharicrinis carchari]|uniref:Peptidyl-prolyl cis-trans isomerase n=1 Tax=Saccharicrinis carchari TaxID=1168039 RepID=A0A521EFM3_SACCC|nr:peptidylprolyl isomerase [Saccharicrinis carchari]SMO82705.1 peptidylprolyl isomerase [Saccharicrinis carchari]